MVGGPGVTDRADNGAGADDSQDGAVIWVLAALVAILLLGFLAWAIGTGGLSPPIR
jgi:hypothetical protein